MFFLSKKIYFWLTLTLIGIFFIPSSSYAFYEYEGVGFYALTHPSAYTLEGVAFYAFPDQITSTIPVYRLYNSDAKNHLFTTSTTERDSIQPEYTYEGIAFYAYQDQEPDTLPVYRFYNSDIKNHFYTANEAEKNVLSANPSWGYRYEGVAFYAHEEEVIDTLPVYRFYSPQYRNHFYTLFEGEITTLSVVPIHRFYSPTAKNDFYTASSQEKSLVENTKKTGYLYKGIAFYAFSKALDDTVPIYRFYNSSAKNHFYTSSEAEKEFLLNTSSGYAYEGIAFYAYTSQINGANPVYRFYSRSDTNHLYTASATERDALLRTELGPEISVGLWKYTEDSLKDEAFRIEANKPYRIKDKKGNVIATVEGDNTVKVTYSSDVFLKVYDYGGGETRVKQEIHFDATDGNNADLIFNVNRPNSEMDHYRGKIKVQYTDEDNVWIINTLPMEHYVWGMGETTGTGDIEHTKVMTTLFRTYGYWYITYATRYLPYGFQIRSDSGSQIYYGYEWEESYPNIKKATQSTRGIVATYKGDVALTPYSSWSDGRTRSFEERWGSDDYPWCKSVKDSYGKHPSLSTKALEDAGNHMVGLIANGSLKLATDHDWDYQKIMKYYYTGIDLDAEY